jgi:hypothetical protein
MTRSAPWIGTGVAGEWTDAEEALVATGLDFPVISEPVYYETGDPVEELRANINYRTGEKLGIVSKSYGIIQNLEAVQLLDPFLKAGGVITHGGMTHGGMVFMVAEMNTYSIFSESFTLYVCLMNSFNAKFPLALIITPVRVICQNMFRSLMKSGDKFLGVKHGKLIGSRLRSATEVTDLLFACQSELGGIVSYTLDTELRSKELEHILAMLFPYVPSDRKQAALSNEKVDSMRSEFRSRFYNAPDNKQYLGTRFGVLNAYYDYVTHRDSVRAWKRDETWEEHRLTGLMTSKDVNKEVITYLTA